MNLVNLYQREIKTPDILMIVLFFASGIAEVAILFLIINFFSEYSSTNINYQYFLCYFVVLCIFVFGKKVALCRIIEMSMLAMKSLTERVSNKIRRSELAFIETMGRESLYIDLTNNSENFNQYLVNVLDAFHAIIIVFISFFYVWFISKEAFFLAAVFVALGYYLLSSAKKIYDPILIQQNIKEKKFLKFFNQLLMGFKELKINSRMSLSHFDKLKKTLTKLKKINIKESYSQIDNYYSPYGFVYFSFLGVLVFILPKISTADSQEVLIVLIAGIFASGPMSKIFADLPLLEQINHMIKTLYTLESKLDIERTSCSSPDNILSVNIFDNYEHIHLENIIYEYQDNEGNASFTLGPINVDIKKGETIFIVGGNGSGKSTLVKLFCGLYFPIAGRIKIDGKPISESEYSSYRNLFSIIMSDFYLFDRIYGFDHIDEDKAYHLLKKMKLETKTAIVDKIFTNTKLSSGQKKRLAMIVALLHDRQIYVFDEWAADQDITFRKYYYETLLKNLKNQGKTILAVSHDDRYYHVADRIIKLDYGKNTEDI